MEKINIAELLKDCPKGMELDCLLRNNPIALVGVTDDGSPYPIRAVAKDGFCHVFTKYGTSYNHDDAKCVIFPKGKTNWEGFVPPCQFKDGDVVTNIQGAVIIYKKITTSGYCGSFVSLDHYNKFIPHYESYLTDTIRLATEEEKAKLFQAIKDNGYKWNAETKILEELKELTESSEDVDDRLVMSGIYFDRENYADEVELHLNNYEIEVRDGKTYAIFKNKKTKKSKPKFKVGDRIKTIFKTYQYVIKEVTNTHYTLEEVENKFLYTEPIIEDKNWELVPNKFDINTLKPFESGVLVRNDEKQYWIPAFWGCKRADGYTTTFGWCKYCIPFEGNEHLLETNNDCDEYFKTWE